jgi:hypothetical protein
VLKLTIIQGPESEGSRFDKFVMHPGFLDVTKKVVAVIEIGHRASSK